MRFLIDGYNLMHLLGLARPRALGQLERCRENLLEWLAQNHRARSDTVAVVFDGSDTISKSRDDYTDHGIRVRFSVGQIADDLIAARGVKHGKLTVTSTGQDLPV